MGKIIWRDLSKGLRMDASSNDYAFNNCNCTDAWTVLWQTMYKSLISQALQINEYLYLIIRLKFEYKYSFENKDKHWNHW